MEEEIKFLATPVYLLQSDDTASRGVLEDYIVEKLEFGMAERGDGVAEGRGVPGGKGEGRGGGREPGSEKAVTHSTGHQQPRQAS